MRGALRKGAKFTGVLAVLVLVITLLPMHTHGHCENPDGRDYTYSFWRWIPVEILIGGHDADAVCLEKFGVQSVMIPDHVH